MQSTVRLLACRGMGEIARRHGYADSSILQVLNVAAEDADVGVRKAAAKALDEVHRFAAGEAKDKHA